LDTDALLLLVLYSGAAAAAAHAVVLLLIKNVRGLDTSEDVVDHTVTCRVPESNAQHRHVTSERLFGCLIPR
jgi:hypothetical protein